MLIPSSSRLLYDEALALDSFGGDRLVTNLPAWVDHWPPAGVVGGQAERDVAGGEKKLKILLRRISSGVRHGLLHWDWTQ